MTQQGEGFRGIFAASLTPQHDDLRIDHDALAAHGHWLLDNGCDGLALFGTTGEATAFSVAERLEALEAVLDAGLPAHRLLVGTGCCAVPDTVTLTRHAVQHGAGGVLLLPPFYYKDVSDDGVFAALDQVIQRVGEAALRVYLYHIPRMTAVPFSHALVERLLTAYPEIVVGMKDSSGDGEHLRRMIEAFPGLSVFSGTERHLLGALQAGGAGCITATMNVTCPLAGQIFAHWRHDDVRPLQFQMGMLRETIESYPVIPALKRIMATWTGQSGWLNLRPPLMPLDDAAAATLLAALQRLNFFSAFV